MIFPHLEYERLVQEFDRTRLDASKTYLSPNHNPIQKIEIRPEALEDFYDITESKHLDWQYGSDGSKAITLRITTGVDEDTLDAPEDSVYSIDVITEEDDHLFSVDNDIVAYEDDILKYVRAGRNTFLDKHRAAQKDILQILDRRRIMNRDGTRLTKDQIFDKVEVREWSKFKTLSIIFSGISNAVDDIFGQKAQHYAKKASEAENFAVIRLDLNKDGEVTKDEQVDLFSTELIRR
jgi:hypothetical protein